jgi:hypothetical protein
MHDAKANKCPMRFSLPGLFMQGRAQESGSKMATMESLAVYFILNEAREKLGFEPEEVGLSDDDAVTIARMFAKYVSIASHYLLLRAPEILNNLHLARLMWFTHTKVMLMPVHTLQPCGFEIAQHVLTSELEKTGSQERE